MYGIIWELLDCRDIRRVFDALYRYWGGEQIVWYVHYMDRLDENYSALENRTFSNQDIQKALEPIQDVLSICVKVYPSAASPIMALANYQAFCDSSCLCAFYCFDCAYQEIYCKDEGRLMKMYDFLKQMPIDRLEVVEKEENIRTFF